MMVDKDDFTDDNGTQAGSIRLGPLQWTWHKSRLGVRVTMDNSKKLKMENPNDIESMLSSNLETNNSHKNIDLKEKIVKISIITIIIFSFIHLINRIVGTPLPLFLLEVITILTLILFGIIITIKIKLFLINLYRSLIDFYMIEKRDFLLVLSILITFLFTAFFGYNMEPNYFNFVKYVIISVSFSLGLMIGMDEQLPIKKYYKALSLLLLVCSIWVIYGMFIFNEDLSTNNILFLYIIAFLFLFFGQITGRRLFLIFVNNITTKKNT